jgi:muramoyltetrapeptide carboxypeptidase
VTLISATRSVGDTMKIGVVAPSCQLDAGIPDRVIALAAARYRADAPEIVFHPQCFLADGHFAGPDKARADAFVEMANDPGIDAIWCARGGYGSNRVAPQIIAQLGHAARSKSYLGYSDAGFLLAGLYAHNIGRVAHGSMPADLNREGGDAAVLRALDWLTDSASAEVFRPDIGKDRLNIIPPLASGQRKYAAFNLTVFSQLLGTSLEPDLSDHILMLEEVAEYMYRIDRSLFHVTSNANVRQVAGIMLGRCSAVPDNDPDFVMDEEQVTQHWCSVSGIPYLGRADIGHDADNKVVPFG